MTARTTLAASDPGSPATGVWIGASYALGRPVPVDAPYPHICHTEVAGRMTPGVRVRLWSRDCAACTADRAGAR